MFGLGIPSCPIFTQFQQVQPEKFVAQLPAKLLGSFFFFLLPGASLPASTVASLYWSLPPYENWSFVGLISNDCPSKLCTVKLPAQPASEDVMVEVSDVSKLLLFVLDNFKLGISVENMSEAALAVPNSPTIVLDQSDLQLLVRGIATDFFRFVESFGQSMGPAGLALVDKWFQKFQEKLQSDPWYWRRISDRT